MRINIQYFIQIERYKIIRSCSFNVYKAYEVNKPKVHYVLKSYKTRDTFERELQILNELKNAEVCIISICA